ncbi:MAG TPA: molybdopterin molybdenumtransferase MoeA [Deltaproteobacteria bacterium]|nr:molybdopterin molybdenumtransferase MoeA [Deltaproteobacteria bacterium]
MLTVEEALELILGEIRPMGLERAELLSALGRVAGEDIRAERPNPPWDNSAMDGYALRAGDTAGACEESPAVLEVAGDVPAGSVFRGELAEGQAVRIMTGAPLPAGANAVVMVEHTERMGEREVAVKRPVRTGENVRRRGEDFAEGDVVVPAGTVLTSRHVSMLATVGRPYVSVFQRPRVAVLSTGDELVEIDEPLGEGKISNSNGYTLTAQVIECGCLPVNLGIARDRKDSLEEKLRAAASADCIISSGGVSVGDYDLVKDVLAELGSEMKFWKVAMKPGKPLAFGTIGGRPAFGLPGNPVSSFMAFEQFVRPALLKMSGHAALSRRTVRARLTRDVKKKRGRTNFLRAVVSYGEDGYAATPLEGQGSGMISTMVKANALVVVPSDAESLEAGSLVDVQMLDGGS